MSRLTWLLGSAAIAAYLLTRRRAKREQPRPPRGLWVWPVPSWRGRHPIVSSGFNSPRPGLPRHGGVDIMYRREHDDAFAAGTPNATRTFVMPDDLPALAAADGTVWSAEQTPRGLAVVIDHSPLPYATFYAHLEKLFVARKDRVRAGEPIGVIGFDPLDSERLKHLHFELWNGGPKDRIDPQPVMADWSVVNPFRNGGFVYRAVGASFEAYPQWVRDLKGKAGVYIIRERGEIVYVGSSVGRLYGTLTRHFQTWRRRKGFWKGMRGDGHDPGLTYDRDAVDVAVRITHPEDALDEEARLIQRLRPRDNLIGQPVEDEVPF